MVVGSTARWSGATRWVLTAIVLAGAFAVSPATAQEQVVVSAQADRHTITMDETVEFSIQVQVTGRGRVAMPPFTGPDFRIRTSFDYTSSRQVGRDRVATHRRVMGLQPVRDGQLEIPALPVNVGGTMYYTDPITIQVTNRPGSPQQPRRTNQIQIQFGGQQGIQINQGQPPVSPTGVQDLPQLPDVGQPDAHITMLPAGDTPLLTGSPSAMRAYVGQQLVLDYELWTNSRGWRTVSLDQPSFPGFWFEAVDNNMATYARRQTAGRNPYASTLVARFILVPLDAGETEIPTLTAELTRRRVRSTVQSDGVAIDVMDLPEGAPSGFRRSNVGRFNFTVDIADGRRRVGDPIRVVMRAAGVGLPGLLQLPELPVTGEAQSQPPVEDREQRLLTEYLVGGHKTVEYVLTPTAEGEVTIGPIHFHYFDPYEESYETVTVDAEVIRIRGVSPNADLVISHDTEGERRSRLLEAMAAPRDSMEVRRPWRVPQPLFWTLVGIPPVALLSFSMAGGVRKRRARNAPDRQRRSAGGQAKRQLGRANKMAGADACGQVAQALRTYLESKRGIRAGALTHDATADAVRELGADEHVATELSDILEACEAGRYSPTPPDAVEDLVSRALDVLSALEAL